MTDLVKAGDVEVKRIEIVAADGTTVNITNQIVDIQIYEDMFSPFITGSFRVIDALSLSSILPLIGEERVNIEIQTPSFSGAGNVISEQFYIYKMGDRGNINDSTVVYTLYFISAEGVMDANRKISKTFQGMHSDIAKSLLGREGLNTPKNQVVESTSTATKIISNFWTPAQTISRLLDDAKNSKGTPSFVFFENREGFVFASLESLYSLDPIQNFVDDNYLRDFSINGKNLRNISEDFKRIRNLHVPEFFDYLDRTQNGFYSSSLTTYDVTTKKYTFKTYFADDNKTGTLNANAPTAGAAPNHSSATRLYVPKAYGNFNGYSDVTDSGAIQQRVSLLKRAEAFKVNIEVPGRTDYTVGRVVTLEIYKDMPIQKGDSSDSILDKMLSGRYLVSAISHNITRTEHLCSMELIKDSLLMNLG